MGNSKVDKTIDTSEKWAFTEEVFSVLRHDVRNRLASVRNAAFYIRRRVQKTEVWKDDPRVETFFRLIDEELAAADDSLTHATSRHVRREVTPGVLGRRVGSGLDTLELPPDVQLVRNFSDSRTLPLEPTEITVLIRCLVHNAIEAMPTGGLITVETADVEDGVMLRVIDTGAMSAEDLLHALDPFVSRKPGHPGIGLNVVRRIADRHHGRISVGGDASGATVQVHFSTTAQTDAETARP